MNKSYKIIFNSHTGVWVAVSELVAARGKRCSSVAAVAAAIAVIGLSNGAYADTPLGGCTPTGASLNEIGIGASTGTCVVQSGGTGAIGIGANVRAVTANGDAIAIGTGAQAEAASGDMLAIGAGARAIGVDSTALGGGTLASGQDSIAIGGNGSSATQTGATTLGYNSNATATRATALGSLANASAENAVAISNGANSASNNGVAIGASTITTTGTSNGVAIGGSAASRAENAVAMGGSANANAVNALALGSATSVTLNNSVALGSGSSATATTATTNWTSVNGVVQGNTFTVNQLPTNGVVAVGNRQIQGVADGEVSATSTNAINGSQLFAAVKALATSPMDYRNVNSTDAGNKSGNSGATGAESIAIGGGATAISNRALATGFQAKASALDAIAIGSTSQALANESVAIGKNAIADVGKSVSIGSGNTAKGNGAVAIGDPSFAIGTGAVVLGADNVASSDGTSAGAAANGAVAIGNTNIAVGQGSVAMGNTSKAQTAGSIALGDTAVVGSGLVKAGVALGSGSSVSTSGGVALGQGSVASVAGGAAGYAPSKATTADKAAITATNSTNLAAVSVGTGAAGGNRQIVNVAAGTNDSDAVNVSQLKSLANSTINFTPDNGTTVTRALGDTLKITSGNATGTATTNLLTKTNAAGDGIEISFKETPTFKGADMSGQKITSVGAGSLVSDSTEAVNGGQLNTAVGSVASKLGGGTTFNPATGQVEGGFTAGGQKYDTVADAISGVANTPLTFAGNSGDNVDRKLGQTFNVKGAATTAGTYTGGNIKTVANGTDGIDIQLADAPVFTGQVKANGFDASGQKIVNVGAGSTTAGSTDAVNGGQLNTALGSVASKLGGGTTFNPATGQVEGGFTAGGQKYDTVADAISGVANTPMSFIGDSGTKVDRKLGETLKITSGTATGTATTNLLTKTNAVGDGIEISFKETPTFKGADMSGQKITSVGAGSLVSDSTDAVNGGQLNTAVGSVASKLGGGTTFNPATGQVEGGFTVGGTTYANVSDAIAGTTSGIANTPMSFIGDSGTKVDRKLGETLKITSGTATGTATTNLLTKTNAAGDGIEISFKETPTFKGADMSGQKITSVGAGSLVIDSTDAVNGGQLNTAVGSVASKLGGGTTFNPATGQVEGGFTVGTTTFNNVADAIAGTTKAIADTPLSFTADSGTKVDRKLGETLKVTSGNATGTATTNLLTKTITDGIEISFKETPTFKGADFSNGTLTNVGAGSLAKGSTDAVNGGQLNTTIGSVASKLGGGTSVNPTTGQIEGGFTAGGQKYDTVADAISGVANTPLTFAGNSGDNVDRKLGQTFNVKGAATTAGTYTGGNIKTVANGTDGIDIQLADAPVFTGQVKANGFDASGQKIVNVGAGSTAPGSTDAVNGGQLNTAVGSVASKLGGGTTFNPATGKLEGGFDAGGKTYGTVADAISDVGAIANKGWNVSTNGGAATNVAPGATVDISAGSTNLLVSNTGTNIKIDLAQDISLNSVKTGNTTMDSTGVAVGSNVKLGATGLVIAGGPSVTTSGVDAGNKVVTNVAAGAVTEDSKDAVNGSQLFAVKQTAGRGWDMTTNAVGSGVAIGSSVANIAPGDTATFTAGNNIIVTQLGKEVQVAVNPELKGLTSVAINGGPTLSSTGIAMGAGNTLNMGGNAITNVAAGTAGSDAVNLNQMTSAIAAAKTKYYSVNSAGGGNLNNDGATGADAIASGKDAMASKDNSVAIGKGATADTFNSVAIGAASKTADVVATSKTTLGGKDYQYAGKTPVGTVSVGSAENERTITNVAAGRVSATSTDAINGSQLHVLQNVLSPLLDAGGSGQVGLLPPSAGGVDSANPGQLLTQTATFNNSNLTSVKVSECQSVAGVDSTGVGLCVKANQKGATALGSNAQATAENATALGFRSTANGEKSVAVGYQNIAAKESVAIGSNNTVTGQKSIAIGVGNTVTGNRSIVIGDPTMISVDGSVSVGNDNTFATTADKSVAIGSNTLNAATQTVALGQGAQATSANSVALGALSVTGNYARTQSVSIGGSTFAFAGSGAELSTVSVGRAGSERQIQNVAAGRISNTSTDAINGSQLYATNQAVETLQAGIGSVYETLNYLDGRITNVARDANAGSASAMAMASMPQAWEPNKTITSMGAASYQGESAYSMGVSRMSDNGRVVLNFGATGNTRNKFGVGVGVGIQW